jgi:hypothetical protein
LKLLLAAVQHLVHLGRIGLVVDDFSIDLDPGVSLEGLLLRADHELGRNSIPFQQTRSGRGSLQTERFFPVPDAGKVNRPANPPGGIVRTYFLRDPRAANSAVQALEVIPPDVKIEEEQFPVRFEKKKEHGRTSRFHTRNCN